jgi:flagellar biosynthesis/type III secretory pathway chaperone
MSLNTIQNLTSKLEMLFDDLNLFKDTLLQESKILQQPNTDELNRLVQAKNNHSQRINTLSKQILDTHPNFFDPEHNHENLTDTESYLSTKIKKLTNECFEINQKNGMILIALDNLNTELIHQIFQPAEQVNLYSASGKTQTNESKKNLGKA